ncbi:hypothetical protein [Bifidobacterium sp. ESL0764]|uniref:hypothetical protein n=1 Tax=Bifidobacterium sp. ESL0764 TaxID=2983228 RepID=UPI0023F9EB25|nr:hypothetical protein [Bifidobacterium sp. ESL0764]WEV66011.1 hypothetical protein OZX71_01230 [Bifidobacterium sp. ESL0764]
MDAKQSDAGKQHTTTRKSPFTSSNMDAKQSDAGNRTLNTPKIRLPAATMRI